MRQITGPQLGQHIFSHPRPIPRHNRRRKGTRITADHVLHASRNFHPQTVDKQPDFALLGLFQHQQRHTRISNRAQTLKPGFALEIKTARLDRTLGRGQMARGHHHHAQFGCDKSCFGMQ